MHDPFADARRITEATDTEQVERIDDELALKQLDVQTMQTLAHLAEAAWLDNDRRDFARAAVAGWIDELREADA